MIIIISKVKMEQYNNIGDKRNFNFICNFYCLYLQRTKNKWNKMLIIVNSGCVDTCAFGFILCILYTYILANSQIKV